ncbi:MAG: hypothetical protein HYZ49_20450 [Chloroflexi bacterium]|nr:hypothetical protein [Chloroflexota bacterium]
MIRIKLKEWLWAVIFSTLVMSFTAAPYLVGLARSNEAWRFSGFVIGVEDGNSYLAKMQLGAHGQWLFQMPYAVEQHSRSLFFLFYILLGKFIGWIVGTGDPLRLHGALVFGYHAARLFWGFALLLVSYLFLAELLPLVRQRRLGLILVGLGGGLGWLLAALRAPGTPLEFYSPEAFTFLDLYSLPHLSASRVFFLGGLLFYLWAVRGRWLWAFAAGAAWFLMTLVQPLYMLIIFVLLTAHIVLLMLIAFRQGESELIRGVDLGGTATRALGVAVLAASGGVPVVLYTFLLFNLDTTYQTWSAQNIILSPAPWHYLSAWGLLALAGLFGLRSLYRRNLAAWALALGWMLTLPMLLYLPYNLQRRLAEGAQLPLVALAILGLTAGIARFSRLKVGKRIRRYAPLVLVAVSLPATALVWVGGLAAVSTYAEPIYQTKDQVATYVFLARSLPPRQVVLSSFEFGNSLPAYGYLVAYIGHGPETPYLETKRDTVAAFYSARTPGESRFSDYSLMGAPYVVVGSHEQNLGRFDPALQAKYLIKIFESGDYSVWSLKPGQ